MPRDRNRAPFSSFGADMKQARQALGYTQKSLAEMVGIDPRYLANIENSGSLPSLPIFHDLIFICKMPVEQYFYPDIEKARESEARERTTLKLHICPEKYLSIIEGTLDATIKLDESGDN